MGVKTKSLVILIGQMLDLLNPDWRNDEDFKETPERVAKMYQRFFRGYNGDELERHISKVFPTNNDQMIIVKDIECFGMCPHHLLPIVYEVDVGYIPKGKAIGLSKLVRLCSMLSAKPKLQENFTSEIADILEKKLHPLGVMVVVTGMHNCMRCRGVESDSRTITSDNRGVLRLVPEARNEFLNLTRRNK